MFLIPVTFDCEPSTNTCALSPVIEIIFFLSDNVEISSCVYSKTNMDFNTCEQRPLPLCNSRIQRQIFNRFMSAANKVIKAGLLRAPT